MRKKIITGLFFILLCTGVFHGHSQQFQRLYGGVNQEISLVALPAPSGGIYFLGATTSAGSGDADASLMKLDDNGQVLWSRTIGGTYLDVAGAMTLATDGGIVCAGSTKSYNGNTPDDLYFFKMDSVGDLIWSKTFTAGGTYDVASAILTTTDGGYAITGFTTINGINNILLIRTDANGDTLFTRIYGGADSNQGVELFETADGGFLITGKTFTQTQGESDILLMRTDASGNIIWTKSFGGQWWDEGAGITRLADGNYFLSGSTISFGQGNFDILLMKTDTSGNILWGKTYGGHNTDASYTARENSDGSILISGYSNSMGYGFNMRRAFPGNPPVHTLGDDSTNIILMKVTNVGDTLWTRSYGDGAKDEAFHFAKMPDGGFIIPGVSSSYTSSTDSTQMLLVRTDSMGHSGCHEQDAHPIIDTTNFVTQTLTLNQSSGFTVTDVVSNDLVWNETAEDACLYPQVIEVPEQSILVYPNPVSTMIHLEKISGFEKIELYNLPGEIILTKNISSSSGEIAINVADEVPGIYFLKLSNSSSSVTKKIIIQKN